MKKKMYVKPRCTVIPVQRESYLLAGTNVSAEDWKKGGDEDLSGEGTELTSAKVNLWEEEFGE